MKTPLPDKLRTDLRKSPEWHRDALQSLIDEVVGMYPRALVGSTKRYSAMYEDDRPVVYIDPQRDRILLGFFGDFIDRLSHPPAIRSVAFPDWNPSKGGLIGYEIEGPAGSLPPALAELRRLIHESYRWV